MLTEAERKLSRGGTELWLAALTPGVFEMIERSALGRTVGHERMFLNLQAAVEAFEPRRRP